MNKIQKIIALQKISLGWNINIFQFDSNRAQADCTAGLLENRIDHIFRAINKSYHSTHFLKIY